jgi:hypothetical protein
MNHNMGLWYEPQSHASFAGFEVGAARLWTRPLSCKCYIQWLCKFVPYVVHMLLFGVFYYIRTNNYYFIY